MTFRFFASVVVRRAQKVLKAFIGLLILIIKSVLIVNSGLSPPVLRYSRQVDIPAVCADKILKAALKHVEIIARAREKGGMHFLSFKLCNGNIY